MSARKSEDLLQDLVDLCRETIDHVSGVDVEEFLGSRGLQRIVERTLELIGEAARQLGDRRPAIDVAWDQITRLRVLLAHVYHKVDARILHEAATREVPHLLAELERYLERKR